jgi:hypothetical protein
MIHGYTVPAACNTVANLIMKAQRSCTLRLRLMIARRLAELELTSLLETTCRTVVAVTEEL